MKSIVVKDDWCSMSRRLQIWFIIVIFIAKFIAKSVVPHCQKNLVVAVTTPTSNPFTNLNIMEEIT